MAFLICKKCHAGIHTTILNQELREAFGWPVDGLHRPGECDGEIEVHGDQDVGAGPGYVPPAPKDAN